jgi:hypothetical protein
VGQEPEAERKAEAMNEGVPESSGGLSATLGVQFVERDGRIYLLFDAGLGPKLIYVGVTEVSPPIVHIVN